MFNTFNSEQTLVSVYRFKGNLPILRVSDSRLLSFSPLWRQTIIFLLESSFLSLRLLTFSKFSLFLYRGKPSLSHFFWIPQCTPFLSSLLLSSVEANTNYHLSSGFLSPQILTFSEFSPSLLYPGP